MLILENICKEINGQKILENISHTFCEGKIYVLKGISGCGKSTLLNIISALDSKFTGSLKYNGVEQYHADKKDYMEYKKRIGYVFQNSMLVGNVSVMDNLKLICNDEEKIINLAKKLKIYEELYKIPEKISGGQRQRVAIVRALLLDCNIIIADEPTAALDSKNSNNLAQLFNEIKDENRIIIIATHENCFDSIADEIINMTYKKIDNIISNSKENEKSIKEYQSNNSKSSQVLFDYLFTIKRNKNKVKFLKRLPSTIILLFILLCITLQVHVEDIFRIIVYNDYPYTIFNVTVEEYNKLKDKVSLSKFDNYKIDDDNYSCLALYDKDDSCLNVKGVIKCGSFPKKDDEVLVNEAFVNNILNIESIEDALGMSYIIESHKFYISGITVNPYSEESSEYIDYIFSNCYYNVKNENCMYIPYKTLSKIGKVYESNRVMVKCDNLYDEDVYEYVNNTDNLNGYISIWDEKIKSIGTILDVIIKLFFVALLFVSIVAIAFINNSIQLELFYRSKEIGYLQVFNISKNRIRRILLFEKLMEWTITIFYSCILYIIITMYISSKYNINFMIGSINVSMFVVITILYCILVSYIPINRFLKKDIISLIKI